MILPTLARARQPHAHTLLAGVRLHALRVDGGMARNAWFLQCQADVLGLPVLQSATSEATALGAAYLAGLGAGMWADTDALRKLARPAQTFTPAGALAARGASGDRVLSAELTKQVGAVAGRRASLLPSRVRCS